MKMNKREKFKVLYIVLLCAYPIFPLLMHLFRDELSQSFLYISIFGNRLYTYISILFLNIAMLIDLIFDFNTSGILSNSTRKTRAIADVAIAVVLSVALLWLEH